MANLLTPSGNVSKLLSLELISDAVMALSLSEERRMNGESKSSNFKEIFQGTNLVCFRRGDLG
jgi:hypothetical protein